MEPRTRKEFSIRTIAIERQSIGRGKQKPTTGSKAKRWGQLLRGHRSTIRGAVETHAAACPSDPGDKLI